MNSHLSEGRLIKLRDQIASLYGEDLAQDMAIRLILRPSISVLSDLQIVTKAKWLSLNQEKRELRFVQTDDEELGNLWNVDDTKRLFARIELRRICALHPRILRLAKVEVGLDSFARQAEQQVRQIVEAKRRLRK